MKRAGVAVGAVLAIAGLGMPAPAVACTCSAGGDGSVIFVGTAVSSEPREDGSIVTFDVKDVVRGDAADGRVWTTASSCGASFDLGGSYVVHADHEVIDSSVVLDAEGCLPTPRDIGVPIVTAAVNRNVVPIGMIGAAGLLVGLWGAGAFDRHRR